jgi:hypothetical protein
MDTLTPHYYSIHRTRARDDSHAMMIRTEHGEDLSGPGTFEVLHFVGVHAHDARHLDLLARR